MRSTLSLAALVTNLRATGSPSVLSALRDRKGAAMAEYALLAGLVAVVAIAGVSEFGTAVAAQFSAICGISRQLTGGSKSSGRSRCAYRPERTAAEANTSHP